MTWFRVDDGTPTADWLLRVPRAKRTAAVGVWALAGAWSARNETDGFVPDYALDEWAGADKVAPLLVTSGVWERADGGHRFTKWAPDQTLAADKAKERADNAARQRASRERRHGVTHALHTPVTHTSVTDPFPTQPVPTQPNPTTDPPTVGVAAAKPRATTRGTRLPADWKPSADLVEWAIKECPAVDGRAESRKFVDYWTSLPGQKGIKLEWDAVFRNWMRRAQENAPALFRGGGNGKPTLDDKVRATLADAARMRAEEEAAEQGIDLLGQLHDSFTRHRQIGTA